jgi:hypothetical protein
MTARDEGESGVIIPERDADGLKDAAGTID